MNVEQAESVEQLQTEALERLSGKPNGLTVYRKAERHSPIRQGVIDLHVTSGYILGEEFFLACKQLEELGLVLTQKQAITDLENGERVTLVVARLTESGSLKKGERPCPSSR
jgi:hypothetical protein